MQLTGANEENVALGEPVPIAFAATCHPKTAHVL